MAKRNQLTSLPLKGLTRRQIRELYFEAPIQRNVVTWCVEPLPSVPVSCFWHQHSRQCALRRRSWQRSTRWLLMSWFRGWAGRAVRVYPAMQRARSENGECWHHWTVSTSPVRTHCTRPHDGYSVIFVLIYFLVLVFVLVFQLFSSFSFVLVLQYFFVLILVLPVIFWF